MPESTDTHEEEIELIAQGPIRHDGEKIAEGESFFVKTKKHARSLIDCGAACLPHNDLEEDDELDGESEAEAQAKADAEAQAKADAEAEEKEKGGTNVTKLHPAPDQNNPKRTDPPAEPDARKAAIVEAMSMLEVGNKAHFTEGGKPDARVLTDLLGWSVSAKERDAIWEELNIPGDDEQKQDDKGGDE